MENASSKITLLLLFAAASLFAGCATTTPPSLMEAAEKGNIKEMERLIAAGADVNAKNDRAGWTPLSRAVYNGRVDVARLLIEKGADVNAKDSAGWTPLYGAVSYGKKEVVSLLITKGADVNARNNGGVTPLHRAAVWGNKEVAELLISKGADVDAKDNAGNTPLDVAEKNSRTSIINLLLLPEAAFTEAARSYRAATVKPALPEEARKFKVQAEFAFNKKEFEGAAARYKEALDVAPWWPDGRFNRALILGELSRYRDAIREMKRYLTLVPDASNVRAAQDKIYQWEGELK